MNLNHGSHSLASSETEHVFIPLGAPSDQARTIYFSYFYSYGLKKYHLHFLSPKGSCCLISLLHIQGSQLTYMCVIDLWEQYGQTFLSQCYRKPCQIKIVQLISKLTLFMTVMCIYAATGQVGLNTQTLHKCITVFF